MWISKSIRNCVPFPSLVVLAVCIPLIYANSCLSVDGEYRDWWVQLIFNGNHSNGFAYFDSSFVAPSFVAHTEKADSSGTALARTLVQINDFNLQTIAWNDEWPTGQKSSVKAHSKGVMAFDEGY